MITDTLSGVCEICPRNNTQRTLCYICCIGTLVPYVNTFNDKNAWDSVKLEGQFNLMVLQVVFTFGVWYVTLIIVLINYVSEYRVSHSFRINLLCIEMLFYNKICILSVWRYHEILNVKLSNYPICIFTIMWKAIWSPMFPLYIVWRHLTYFKGRLNLWYILPEHKLP